MSTVEIRDYERDDFAACLELLVSAFLDEAGMVYIVPDKGRREECLRLRFAALLRCDAEIRVRVAGRPARGCAIVRDSHRSPPVETGIRWTDYEQLRGARLELDWEQLAPGDAVADLFFAYLGVHPAAQGQGIGTALVRDVLALAAAQGRGCLLSTISSRDWYAGRFGFRELGQAAAGGGAPVACALRRDAPARG